MSHKPLAAKPLPEVHVSSLEGKPVQLGGKGGAGKWQLIVVYRGLHCPLCKKYLSQLNELADDFADRDIEIIAVSTDDEDKAAEFAKEAKLKIPIAHSLSLADARLWGLYISEPRSAKETDAPFAEPALFVLRPDGLTQIIDISNAPFARPDLNNLLQGLSFIQDKDYPVRGTVISA